MLHDPRVRFSFGGLWVDTILNNNPTKTSYDVYINIWITFINTCISMYAVAAGWYPGVDGT